MANVQIRSFGGLNTDTHVQDLRNGDYPDAKNIDHISAVTGESVAVTPRMGNEYAFDIGEVTAQDKRYVITFPDFPEPEGGYILQVYRSDQINPLFPSIKVPEYFGNPSLLPGNQAATAIQNAFASAGYFVDVVFASSVYPSLSGTNSLLITPSTYSPFLHLYDYFISSIGANVLQVDVIQESISNSRTGILEVIGSKDLLGDLFIISSSKRERPFEVGIQNISIVNYGGVSTLMVTPDPTDQVILDGSEVYITGVQGIPEANGIFVINVAQDPQTGQTILLLFNSFAVPGQSYVLGSGVIKFNELGMGEIGVAQKDISSNTWKYTRLLRSKELNLFTYHQCDVQGEKSFNRKSIYFTDFNDVPRNFYYKIDTEYYTDGALEILYPDSGYYNYGSVSDQTTHILGQPSLDIDFISQSQGGGSLSAGNHVYFARGVLGDGSYTDWSLPSRYIPVYSASSLNPPKNIIGDISGTQTNKANQITISNISNSIFDYIEICCLNYIEIGTDPTIYGIFAKIPISRSTNSITVLHTGRENVKELNADELSVQTEVYTKAKNNAIIDNRYLLSNLSIPSDDLSFIFDKIKYSLKTKQITKPRYNNKQIFGGHQDPYNVYYYSGYMLNETYRIGARVKYKNGYISPVYIIFEATIDTDQDSLDGKRISGLSNYDLNVITDFTLDIRGRLDPSKVNNIVPYIEIIGPNLSNEIINGIPANLVIDRIEYFRAEVITPSIIGSGYAVMHVKSLTTNTVSPPRYVAYVSNTENSSLFISSQLPTIDQDTSSPVNNFPMISYEFPFVLGNLASQQPVPELYDLPNEINYYDSSFTINSGARAGTDFGFQWNEKYASIYLIDAFLNENFENIEISPGDSIINLGQPSSITGFTSNTTRPTNRYKEFISVNNFTKEVIKIDDSLFVPNGNPLKLSNDYVTKSIGIDKTNSQFTIPDATQLLLTTGNYANLYDGLWGFKDYITGAFITSVGWNGGEGAQVQFVEFWNEFCTNGITCAPLDGLGLIFTSPSASDVWNGYQFLMTQGSNESIVTLSSVVSEGDPIKYSFYQGYITKLISTPSSLLDTNYKLIDRGLRAIQIKRDIPKGTQYSQEGLDNYVYTGSYQKSSSNDPIDIFGGDTLTTQLYVKTITQVSNLSLPMDGGMQQGILVTSQTKSNPYLIYKIEDEPLYPATYDLVDPIQNLFTWLNKRSLDKFFYNYGYSINNLGTAYRAGNVKDINSKLQTRVIYSDSKPQNARSDFYRRFGVLSYNDLDASFGEINSMKNINGELFTLQVNKLQKQFFNTRGTLQVSDGSQVVLGDAGVFSRPGVTITSYGCSDKWSSFLGKSAGGDDVLYWYDSINKKFMRFGSDGAVPISDRANIRTLSNEGFKWVINYQTPADNYGIHGIWNQRLNEASWTCRAYRKPDVIWGLGITINEGELVIVEDTSTTYGFEQFPVIYKCIQTNVATIDNKPGDSFDYEQYYDTMPFDDIEYYSLRTIIWSEVKNRFIISNETPHPRIYLQYKDTFLSPSPASNSNQLYEHNEGKYLEWYINGQLGQREDGYIDIVFNIDPNTTKHFISLICNTEIVPYKVEAFTKNHSTLINPVEFLEQLDQYVAPIPNNLQNGSTGEDNTFLYGQWIKVRFHYQTGMFQRLTNMILKFNPMARLWNS
jgi:hypothetical protein